MIQVKKLSIIDIGSNSIKLLITNIYSQSYFDIIYEEKIPLRMSQFMNPNQTLNDEGFDKLMEILSYFKHLSDFHEVDTILAIATETTRRLENAHEILKTIHQQLQIQIEILSGEMEAYYGYLATLHTIDLADYLQIDIGGSSMEIVLVKNKQLIHSISLPLGAIVTTKKFNLDSEITPKKENQFNDFLYQAFDEIPWLKDAIYLPIIGIGGTIRTISKLYRNSKGDSLKLHHQYTLTSANLQEVYQLLAPLSLKERLSIKGLSKERADIVLGCLMTVHTLSKYIDSKTLVINRYGIRQGMIFNQLTIPIHSVLDYSLCNFLHHFQLPVHFNDRLKQSTLTIAHELNMTDSTSIRILKTISKLHQIGRVVSFQNINKHSFYLLMNNQINGLLPKEQLMSAYSIRCLDRLTLKLEPEHKNILSIQDIEQCKKLSLILQLASYLTILKSEFVSLQISKQEINLQFSKPIPENYSIKLQMLSTLFVDNFNHSLTFSN